MKEKNNITLLISKTFTTIFDHQFDMIEKHNKETFENILGIFLLTQQD